VSNASANKARFRRGFGASNRARSLFMPVRLSVAPLPRLSQSHSFNTFLRVVSIARILFCFE
jgi:hypothetical protein